MLRLACGGACLLCLVACGGHAQPGLGGSAQGGSEGGSAGGAGGRSSPAGSPSQAGTGGQAGAAAGGGGHLPGATEQEEEVVAPLFVDPAAFVEADLAELTEWAARVALARGYALCRCATSAAQPPTDVGHLLSACAKDEGGGLRDFIWYPSPKQGLRVNQDLARCMAEAPDAREALDGLRCELERQQRDGRNWLEVCAMPGGSVVAPAPVAPCADADDLERRLAECQFVGYCADGARMALARCNGNPECADSSDEHGCFEVVGNDMLQCGNEIFHGPSFCDRSTCGTQTTPPLCDPARPDRFLCSNGNDIAGALVCDRTPDCPDRADEQHCLP